MIPWLDCTAEGEDEVDQVFKQMEDIAMNAADKEASGKRKTSAPNVSIMNADTLNKMKKLFKQLGGGDKDSASESSSEGRRWSSCWPWSMNLSKLSY